MDDKRPSALEFVRTASLRTLEDFELARRNEAATLAKQIRSLVWAMASALADAELARLWRETRQMDSEEIMLPDAECTPDGAGRRRL